MLDRQIRPQDPEGADVERVLVGRGHRTVQLHEVRAPWRGGQRGRVAERRPACARGLGVVWVMAVRWVVAVWAVSVPRRRVVSVRAVSVAEVIKAVIAFVFLALVAECRGQSDG